MHEIICPGCGKAFKIDASGYADILKQVHDREFEQALRERLELVEKEKQTAVKLAETELAAVLEKDAAVKNAEIERLKEELKSREIAKQLAVNEAVGALEKERDRLVRDLGATESEQKALQAQLGEARKEKKTAVELAEANLANKLQAETAEKAAEIARLKEELKSRDEMISYYKGLKAKLSTKLVGETLEQHCETSVHTFWRLVHSKRAKGPLTRGNTGNSRKHRQYGPVRPRYGPVRSPKCTCCTQPKSHPAESPGPPQVQECRQSAWTVLRTDYR